jgi:hypothetical protein
VFSQSNETLALLPSAHAVVFEHAAYYTTMPVLIFLFVPYAEVTDDTLADAAYAIIPCELLLITLFC